MGNDVGWIVEDAADLEQTVALGVLRPLIVVGKAEFGDGVRRLDARRPQLQIVDPRYRRRLDLDADPFGQTFGLFRSLCRSRLFRLEAVHPDATSGFRDKRHGTPRTRLWCKAYRFCLTASINRTAAF